MAALRNQCNAIGCPLNLAVPDVRFQAVRVRVEWELNVVTIGWSMRASPDKYLVGVSPGVCVHLNDGEGIWVE